MRQRSSSREIFELIDGVARQRSIAVNLVLRPHGVTRSQWSVLSVIARAGRHGMKPATLARFLELGKVSMSGLIHRLTKTGHVMRASDPSDGRSILISTTEQGERVLNLMRAVVLKLNKRALKDIDTDELDATERVLQQIKDNMKALLESESSSMGDLDALGPNAARRSVRAPSASRAQAQG